MIAQIEKHIEEVSNFSANSLEEVEAFRIKYLGKKGLITQFFADFKNVPNEEKKLYGHEDTVSQEELPTSHSKFRKEFTEFKDKYEAKDIENAFRLRNYKPPTDPRVKIKHI